MKLFVSGLYLVDICYIIILQVSKSLIDLYDFKI